MLTKATGMAPPATNKTFYLSHPRDYFDKLEWEFHGLKKIPATSDKERAFQTMNCVTTAWHMSDWVYEFMSSTQWAERTIGKDTKSGYQTWLRKRCGALHICRQLATANKHVRVAAYDDAGVTTDHFNMAVRGQPTKRFRTEPVILFNIYRWNPEQVMDLVLEFWRDELTQLQLFVEPSPWGRVERGE